MPAFARAKVTSRCAAPEGADRSIELMFGDSSRPKWGVSVSNPQPSAPLRELQQGSHDGHQGEGQIFDETPDSSMQRILRKIGEKNVEDVVHSDYAQ